VTVQLDAGGRGTFMLRGGLVDSGAASARRAVVGGRLHATIRLTGAKGVLVTTSSQPCARTTGTWRIVSGTLAYAGASGRGTTTGRVGCRRPFSAVTVVHRGTVDLPPPVLAQPGAWGGWTAQGHALTFTVLPGGRQIANLLLGGYRYDCVRSDGFRSTEGSEVDRVFPGPFAIGDDRTFSVKTFGPTIEGRFTASGAAGTASNRFTRTDIQKLTTTCSISIAWTATQPPPPPKRALAGTYCGFRVGGGGACIDVASDGREARNVRAEVWLTCGPPPARFEVRVPIAYDQPIRLDSDLSFRQSFTVPFEGGTSGASVGGVFDENGALAASVGLSQPTTVVRNGARHFCQSNGGFTAKLQR